MSMSNSEGRKRAAGIIDGPDERVGSPPPTVPRVARSVDDLRVGMTIASKFKPEVGDGNLGWLLDPGLPWFSTDADDAEEMRDWWNSKEVVVILADAPDPPARDWLVPATQMEVLREGMREIDRVADAPSHPFYARDWEYTVDGLLQAARAVLDAAREVEHE